MYDSVTAEWPAHVSVSLTDKCQLKCATCSHSYHDKSIFQHTRVPPERIREFVSNAKVACLHGLGEVLLHPGVWDIVPNPVPDECHLGWATTGHALTDRHIDKIVESRVKFLSISFLGGPEMYRKLHGASWKHAWKRIDALIEKRNDLPALLATYMVMNCNMHETPEIVKMCGERKFQDVRLFHMNRVDSWPGSGKWADGTDGFDYMKEQEIDVLAENRHVMDALRVANEYDIPVLGIGLFCGSRWNHEDMRTAMV